MRLATYDISELSAIVLALSAEVSDLNHVINNTESVELDRFAKSRRADLRARILKINNRIITATEV